MTDNACKSTSDNVNKIGDTIADKYALELQTTMKKERLILARQAPDNILCITQNTLLFASYPFLVFDTCINAEFFSFLRLSNLVPHVVTQYSPLKHLSRGDVIFRPGKAVILVKWSKTMQNNDQVKLITVPRSNLLLLTSKGANLPLFQIKVAQEWIPLTDSRVSRHFEIILSRHHLKNTS